MIYSFKKSREDRSVPNMSDAFIKKLYSTYLSYLPEDKFSYNLKMNIDNRAYLMDEALSDDRTQLLIEGYMRGFEAALKAIYGEGEPHVSN